jgi:DNA-binding GntR family transcriptional regulator
MNLKAIPAAQILNIGIDMDLRVNHKTVQQGIVEKLRTAILSGMLKPGDRLVEVELCASLGVSRPSLREALRNLQAEKLIEFVPNRGPQIPILTWEEARQIYHVRELLEGEAAALCASVITAQDLSDLALALDMFRKALDESNSAGLIDATGRFYATMLRSSGNGIIFEVLQGLVARINFLRARSMSRSGRAKQSLAEMKAIFSALKRHNPDGARYAARLHVAKAREAAQIVFST